MKPIEFPEQNVVFAKDQPEYLPLPAFHNKESKEGEVISCWKATWKERFKFLFTGKLWINELSFNKPLTPILPTLNKWDLLNKEYWKNQNKK